MLKKDILKYFSCAIAIFVVTCLLQFNPNAYAAIIYGDVSGDGIVDSADYTLLRKYLMGIIKTLPANDWQEAGDVNLDGLIDSADYTNLRRYLMTIIKSLPVGNINITPTSVPVNTVYQAEEATIYSGITETTNAGYTGNAYVNYDNAIGSYVEWKVNVASSGYKALTFRYANGTTVDRIMDITVNDRIVASNTGFGSTGSWTDWTTNTIIANLNSGSNIIRATATTANGGPNVDCLEIKTSTVTPTPTLVVPTSKPTNAPTPYPTYPGKPIVYLAGDSTVQTYTEAYYPQQGWGQRIGEFFTSDVTFVNKSIGGRSSKSFIDEGRLTEILNVIKPGDYLFCQWGINDRYKSDSDRYTDPSSTFRTYLKKYIDGAKAKGAIPVIFTPTARFDYVNGVFQNDFTDYCNAAKAVANETDTKFVDLQSKALKYLNSIGYDKALALYKKDDVLHFNNTGAYQMARLVAEGVKEINVPISKYVK